VDAILCRLQKAALQDQPSRSRPLSVRLGMVIAMAKVIEFYIPKTFRNPTKTTGSAQRGKLIEFPVLEKKPA
jgi:hypothetical protein